MTMNRATIGTRRKRHALDSTTAKHGLAPGKIRKRDDGKEVLARQKKPSDRLHWRYHDRSQEVCYREAKYDRKLGQFICVNTFVNNVIKAPQK